MVDTQFALPSISNKAMPMTEQRELLRTQVVGQIVSAWLEHSNTVLQYGLSSIEGGTEDGKKKWFITMDDLTELIDKIQEALSYSGPTANS